MVAASLRLWLAFVAILCIGAQPPPPPGAPGGTSGGTSCDACGLSASYIEAVIADGGNTKRTIRSTGCPNHYSVCTGKPGISVCGDVGAEGTGTEAAEQSKSLEIPASPVLATSTTDVECTMGAIAIALNGVSIYGGAVDTSCTKLDVDSASSEWTGFDMCSGHSEMSGDYHYHFPPSCLLAQANASNPTADGHSPQIGWAYDGFPIYGHLGPGGVAMTQSDLDECSGKEQELPSLDKFKYRYYFTGATSDLYALPTHPKPDAASYPFSIKCYKGCDWSSIKAGTCEGESGVADGYVAAAHSGYMVQFAAYGIAGFGTNYAGNTYTSAFLSAGQCSSIAAGFNSVSVSAAFGQTVTRALIGLFALLIVGRV